MQVSHTGEWVTERNMRRRVFDSLSSAEETVPPRLFVCGGFDINLLVNVASVEVYDCYLSKWTRGTPLPFARCGAAGTHLACLWCVVRTTKG